MAISVRDTFSLTTQEPQAPMVRNDVGHPSFTITIDGKVMEAYQGQTILSVAVDHGISDIPNLCNDEKLDPTSACRMCLPHIDIPGYLELIAQGSMKEASRLVKEVLPFPYILGLTCPAPCQKACRRALVEEEIAICRM